MISHFSVVAFKVFSFSLAFINVTVMCLGVDLFVFLTKVIDFLGYMD